MSVCHVVVDAAGARSAPADAIVVDLTVPQVLAGQAASGPVIAANVGAPEVATRALARYLAFIEPVPDLRVGGARVGSALAYDGALSLWWFLPSAMKHPHYHPLPHLVQLGTWAASAPSEPAARALADAADLVVHASSRVRGRIAAAMLRPLCRAEPRVQAPQPRRALRSLAAGAGLRVLALAEARRALTQQGRAGEPEGPVDVLFSTVGSSWDPLDTPGATGWNRYLADVPQRLQAAGLRVAWLPRATSRAELATLGQRLRKTPVPVAWAAGQLSRPELARLLGRVARVQLSGFRLARALREHPGLSLDGVDLSPLIVDELQRVLLGAHDIALSFEERRRAVLRLRPKVMLLKDEFSAEGLAGCAAATPETQVWTFQHGTIPRDFWHYRHGPRVTAHLAAQRAPDFTADLPAPTRFLCFGDYEREMMAETGYPASAVSPIGSLRFDALFERAAQLPADARAGAREALGLPGGRVILVCGQLVSDVPRWLTLLVSGLRSAGAAAHIVFKPHWKHPSADLARETLGDLGWTDFRVHDADLHTLIIAADLMLSGTSTTVVEAAILGCPVIVYRDPGRGDRLNYVDGGLAPGVLEPEDMTRALTDWLAPDHDARWRERRDRWLHAHLWNAREPATARLIAMINEGLRGDSSKEQAHPMANTSLSGYLYADARFRTLGSPVVPLSERARGALDEAHRYFAAHPDAERLACPCGDEGHRDEVVTLADRHGLPCRLVLCPTCGLIRMNPRPTPETLTWFYSDTYRRLYDPPLQGDALFDNKTWKGRLVRRVLEGSGQTLPEGPILDVGCGGGWSLAAFADTGRPLIGYDYDPRLLELGRSRGLDLRPGGLEGALEAGTQGALVICSHVLEHTLDPVAHLASMAPLVAPGGLLYVEVPHTRRVGTESLAYDSLGYWQRAHLWDFQVEHVVALAQRAGYAPAYSHTDDQSAYVLAASGEPDPVPMPSLGSRVRDELLAFEAQRQSPRARIELELQRASRRGKALLKGVARRVRGS